MRMQQLHYFTAVVRAGSFSQAAKDLYMTQPPLSSAIAKLEEQLGAQLLVRHSRGVSLTTAGEAVLRYAARVTQGEKELIQTVNDLQEGRAGNLIVGYSHILSVPFIAGILRELSRQSPKLGLTLHETDPVLVVDSVIQGDYDVGLVATAATDDIRTMHQPMLAVDRVGEIPMMAALPPQLKWPAGPVSLADLENFEVAVPSRSLRAGLHVELATAFLQADLKPPQTRAVSNLMAVLPMVASGVAIAFVPASFQDFVHPGLVQFRNVQDGPRALEISSIYKAENLSMQTVERFKEVAASVCSDVLAQRAAS